MTVAVNDTIERYVIAGAGPYPYSWRIFNDTDLQVYALSTASPPVPVLLTYLTHYTVSGANDAAGGSITLLTAAFTPYAGYTLDIRANTPENQPTSIRNIGRFLPEIHEDAYDYLSRQIQDLRRLVNAKIGAPDNEPVLALTIPPVATRAGTYGAYDVLGQPISASGTGNDSALRTDLAITVAGSDGSRLVGFRRTEAGSIARSVYSRLADRVSVADFGTNTAPGTTDMTAAIQAAVNAAAARGEPAYLPSSMGECKITAPILITSSRSGLVGDGKGLSRILTTTNAFTVSPGLICVTLRGFTIAAAPRYTVTPNALTGINITGTTASQVYWSRFEDLFIDGFELAIQANGVCQTSFTGIDTEFCHRGLVSLGQTLNNNIVGCWFVGAIGSSTRGIAIGDGIASNEGWMISDCLVYGHSRNIAAFGSVALKVNNCLLDFGTEFGVLLQSSGPNPCVLCSITNNYIAMTGAADSGVYLANSVAAVAGQTGNRIAGNNILVYAASTLTNGILADGTADTDHTIEGNTILATTFDVRLAATAVRAIVVNNHAYGPGYSFVGGADPTFENNRGTVIGGTIPSVASAAAVTLPVGPKVYTITGVTNITSIVATGHTGRTVTLIFAGILTFTDGSNLKLSANFVTSADDTITLVCDGTNWFEIARSAN